MGQAMVDPSPPRIIRKGFRPKRDEMISVGHLKKVKNVTSKKFSKLKL